MLRRALVWLGSSLEDVRQFPADARQVAGFQLRRIQDGLDPDDWRPMPAVGLGVREIRIRTTLAHRVLYVTRSKDAVYVLHAFEKRSRKTSARDVEIARHRMRLLEAERTRLGR